MQSKKIIIIGPAYPYRGGNSLFVSHVFDSLSKLFDIKIYNYKLLYPKLLFPGTTQFDESTKLIKKAPNERLINSINPFNWISVAQKLKKEKADLIVFDWWHPFFGPCHFVITSLIKKYYKNKILFITENFVSHEGNFVDKFLTRLGLSNASRFLSLSEKVEKELKDTAADRKIYRSELPVYDCYNNEDKSLISTKKDFGFSENDKVLLFFGYVRRYKGLDILLSAFPGIKKDFPDAKLLVVGEFYDDPNIYNNMIKQLEIEKDVKIINSFVSNEEVYKYYMACDLVLLPYRSATQSGILNVAYGFSKPVLVTDVGGLAEFVKNKETGLVIQPDSPDSLVKGVKEFFNLKDKVNFESNIRNIVGENMFNKLPELFNKIIEDSE